MVSESGLSSSPVNWKIEYSTHLAQRLDITTVYVQMNSVLEVQKHFNSILALLNEAHCFPHLAPNAGALIASLHSLPLRWGQGRLWEQQLKAALQDVSINESDLGAQFHVLLAEIDYINGQVQAAIAEGLTVLKSSSRTSLAVRSNALRWVFLAFRSSGERSAAVSWLNRLQQEFAAANGGNEEATISSDQIEAWLYINYCQLIVLRDEGRLPQALALVEQMIATVGRLPYVDLDFQANLYVRRAILRWATTAYSASIDDYFTAIRLFKENGDIFNAEILQSDLGLVYWTMGELNQAETALERSMKVYRDSGSDLLLIPDIGNLGLVYFARGDLEEALRLTELHIEQANQLGARLEANRGRCNRATILGYLGRTQEAQQIMTEYHSYFSELGSRDAYQLDRLWLAHFDRQLGNADGGLAEVQSVLKWTEENDSRLLRQLTLRLLAGFLPPAERISLYQESLELARASGRKLEEAAVMLTMAGCLPVHEQAPTWRAGANQLRMLGAGRWLDNHSLENPPMFPLLL